MIVQREGNLAVIGRNAAVADFGVLRFGGFPAWLIWLLVHIAYLIEFDNKLLVLIQWAWNYLTRKRGARLITGEDLLPVVHWHQEPTDSTSAKDSGRYAYPKKPPP